MGELPEDCAGDAVNSRTDLQAAGWEIEADPEEATKHWRRRLEKRSRPKWDSFSWLTVRALYESINDVFAKAGPTIVRERRARWVAGQRASGVERAHAGELARLGKGTFGPDFVIDRTRIDGSPRFLLLGDPGEADASQYAVIDPMLAVHRGAVPPDYERTRKSDFMVVVSDVIYPAGDINEYVNAFYLPYQEYNRPIYALPGNHDWYDGLNGFMFHFCAAEPLPPVAYRSESYAPGERAAMLMWRGAAHPDRDALAPWMAERARRGRHERFRAPGQAGEVPKPAESRRPVQPAPYFAIDTGRLLIVSIDTGVMGELDAEQGEWLRRVSSRKGPKILLTGKPIYVNNTYHPCPIVWSEAERDVRESPADEGPRRTVDDIVRDPRNRYVAAIGGDIHNYQRYPVELTDGRKIQYIVSGGAGAYLSATHTIPEVGPTASQKLPPDVLGFNESDFRCYPLRGHSLALYTRTAGPLLFKLMTGAPILILATFLMMFAVVGDLGERRLPVLWASLAGTVLVAAMAGGFIARDEVIKRTTAGYRALLFGGLAGIAGLAVAFVFMEYGSATTNSAASIALGFPFAVVAAAIVAYTARGSRPEYGPTLLLLAPVVALWEIFRPCDLDGGWALAAYVLAPLLALLFSVVVSDLLRRHVTNRDGLRKTQLTAVVVAWGVLTLKLLYDHAEPHPGFFTSKDWLTLSMAILVGAVVVVTVLLPQATSVASRAHQTDHSKVRDLATGTVGLALVVLALLALGELGNGWPAKVTALSFSTFAGCLAAVILAAGWLGLVRHPVTLWQMRNGEVDPRYASEYMKSHIGGDGEVVLGGVGTVDESGKRRMLQAVRRLGKSVSEIAESNAPPFYKSFLSADVEGTHLVIRSWGVTGYTKRPTLEDCVRIPLGAEDPEPVPHGTAHSRWALWTTWRRGPDLFDHVADLVADATGSPAQIEVVYKEDRENATSGVPLADQITGEGLGGFRAILVEGGGPQLRVRIAFVRRKTDVLIGEDQPRRAHVRAGVVLEVTTTDPEREDDVAVVKQDLADAIERGRPRFGTREARHGQAARGDAEGDEPGSASRKLERNLRGWPKWSPLPLISVVLSVALYAGIIVLLTQTPIPALYDDKVLAWDLTKVKRVVVAGAVAIAVAAFFAQRWLFPSVEVATLTKARRATRLLTSGVTLSAVTGFLLKIPWLEGLFKDAP